MSAEAKIIDFVCNTAYEDLYHSHSVETLAAVGRDTEMRVLARAVRFQAEHRVIVNGRKTVVFD